MAYKGFVGSGTVGHFPTSVDLQAKFPADSHTGRMATVENGDGTVSQWFSDGDVWNVRSVNDLALTASSLTVGGAALTAEQVAVVNAALGGGGGPDWKNAQNRRRSLKVLAGYMQAGGTGVTYQVATTAEAAFIAVRLVLLNPSASPVTVNCAVAPGGSPSVNTPSGAWVAVTVAGSAAIVLPAGDGVRRPSVTVTDWINVASIARSDGGTLPVLFARLYSAGQVYVTGNTSSTDGSWGTGADAVTMGRVIYDGSASGDFVTTNQAGYTGTTTYQTAITGFEFLHATDVMTVMSIGDSQHQGDGGGAAKLMGPVVRSAIASSVTGSKPVQYANYGWSGDKTDGYLARLQDMIAAGVRPHVIVTSPWSTNDVTTSSVAFFGFAVARMRDNAIALKKLCDIYGIKLVWVNWFPYVYAENRDSLRRSYNIEIAALAASLGITLIDWDSAIKAGTTPDTIAAGLTSDTLHPNDAGNAALTVPTKVVVDALRDEFFV